MGTAALELGPRRAAPIYWSGCRRVTRKGRAAFFHMRAGLQCGMWHGRPSKPGAGY